MRNWSRGKKVLMFVIVMPIAIAAFGCVTMSLWNWLMPAIFSLPVLTFWQALGLLVLSWILFGGRRGMGGGHHHGGGGWQQRKWIEKWEKMTPEEREEFKKKVEGRCERGSRGETAESQ